MPNIKLCNLDFFLIFKILTGVECNTLYIIHITSNEIDIYVYGGFKKKSLHVCILMPFLTMLLDIVTAFVLI